MDDFAGRYGQGVLQGAGTVSRQAAVEKAAAEYRKYRKQADALPSAAERDYLDAVKQAQKRVEGKRSGGKAGMAMCDAFRLLSVAAINSDTESQAIA